MNHRASTKSATKPRLKFDGVWWFCVGHGSRGNWASGRGFTPAEAYKWWSFGNI